MRRDSLTFLALPWALKTIALPQEKQKVCIDIWVVKPYIFWLVYDVFQVILDTQVGLAVFLGPVYARDG